MSTLQQQNMFLTDATDINEIPVYTPEKHTGTQISEADSDVISEMMEVMLLTETQSIATYIQELNRYSQHKAELNHATVRSRYEKELFTKGLGFLGIFNTFDQYFSNRFPEGGNVTERFSYEGFGRKSVKVTSPEEESTKTLFRNILHYYPKAQQPILLEICLWVNEYYKKFEKSDTLNLSKSIAALEAYSYACTGMNPEETTNFTDREYKMHFREATGSAVEELKKWSNLVNTKSIKQFNPTEHLVYVCAQKILRFENGNGALQLFANTPLIIHNKKSSQTKALLIDFPTIEDGVFTVDSRNINSFKLVMSALAAKKAELNAYAFNNESINPEVISELIKDVKLIIRNVFWDDYSNINYIDESYELTSEEIIGVVNLINVFIDFMKDDSTKQIFLNYRNIKRNNHINLKPTKENLREFISFIEYEDARNLAGKTDDLDLYFES